jgi:hypothetical protein
MEEIFDRLGNVVGWRDQGAISIGRAVDGSRSSRMTWYTPRAVAFAKDASRGPGVPAGLPKLAPPTLKPARPRIRSLPPLPIAGVRWGTDWWSFVHKTRSLPSDKLGTKTPKAA